MHRTLLVAVCAAAAVSLAACSDAADQPTTAATTDAAATTEATAATTATVTGVDYAFEDLQDTYEAGTELQFTNASEQEVHELVLVRVPDDDVRSADELLALPQEESQALIGQNLAGVSVAMPGEDGRVVDGSLALEEPGRYLALCFIQTGVDPEVYAQAAAEDEGGPVQIQDGGPPHVVHGMVGEFTVGQG